MLKILSKAYSLKMFLIMTLHNLVWFILWNIESNHIKQGFFYMLVLLFYVFMIYCKTFKKWDYKCNCLHSISKTGFSLTVLWKKSFFVCLFLQHILYLAHLSDPLLSLLRCTYLQIFILISFIQASTTHKLLALLLLTGDHQCYIQAKIWTMYRCTTS